MFLSPLAHETVDSWGEAVARGLVALFRADQSIFAVPMESDFEFLSSGMESHTADAVRETLVAVNERDLGKSPYADVYLQQLMVTLRAKGIEVWNNPLINHLMEIKYERTRFFREVVGASGVVDQTVMGMAFGEGMAMTGIAHTSSAGSPFSGRELEVMRLLLPAFKAGVHMQVRLAQRRSDLGRCLDALKEPLMVQDLDGRGVHRNPALRKLLEDEPESDVVLSAMRALGMNLVRRRYSHRKSSSESPLTGGSREVRTARGVYTFRAGYLAPGVLTREAVVLVTVATGPPRLPSVPSLRRRFDLTPREAEVALLLAEGHSNREIAKILSISPHTVRHHAEHVFLKLDVHTRKVLALRLLGEIG